MLSVRSKMLIQLLGDSSMSYAKARKSWRSHSARGMPKPVFSRFRISLGNSPWNARLRMYFCSVFRILSAEGTLAQNSTSL